MVNLPLIYEKDTELHTVQLKNYEQTVKNLPRNKAFFEAFLHSKDMLDEETVSFYVWLFRQFSLYNIIKEWRTDSKHFLNQLTKGIFQNSKSEIAIKEPFQTMIVRENVYGYIKKNKVGRIYSSSRSLQSLKREVRTLLLRDTYVDLDLKSSSFSILLEYAKDHNLEHEVPTLIRYVLSKDSLIDETVQRILHATKYADNEDYIKTTRENVSIILKKEFIRNSNVEIKLKINRMPFFMLQMIRKIQLEVSIIRNHLVKNEMVLQKYKIDYTDKKPVSIQCEYIHTMESKLLEYLIVELEKNGVNHFIPMFDGVAYIPSENPFDIDSFNSRLRKEFNYKYVTFSEKIWEDPKILEGLNLKKLREKYIFHKNTAEILLEEKQKELEEFFTKDFLFTEYKNMDEKLLYMEIFELFEKQKDLYILQNMEELHYILSIDPLSLESIRESLKEGIKSDLDSIPERVRELCDKFRIKSQQ